MTGTWMIGTRASGLSVWVVRLVGVGVAVLVGAIVLGSMSGAAVQGVGQPDDTWWADRELVMPVLPSVVDGDWSVNAIDRFVLARLEGAGLTPVGDASRRSLIRRATYDLIGLPPTPEEVAAFVEDDSPGAYAALVERLLASEQYGVKWGRHWLDLVRYAETDGYERDRVKPGVWRYRDYVVDAFNSDKPYDEFVVEQLAGDEIDRPTLETMVATGYYHLGIRDDEPTDTLLAQYDDLDGVLDTTSRVMLGVSMGCARCHDHKGDPIGIEEYYGMLSFFRGVKPYKEGGGNSTTEGNFVKRVREDLGDEAATEERDRAYVAERAALERKVSGIVSAAIGSIDESARERLREEGRRGEVIAFGFSGEDDEGLVVEGAAGRTNGKVGRAASFDGRGQYLRIERPIEDDFSISLWFASDSRGPGGRALKWWEGAGLVDAEVSGIVDDFGIAFHSDGYVVAGTGKPETNIYSGPGHNDGLWHHVLFTRERATGELNLYVDGARVGSTVASKAALNTPTFVDIGRLQVGRGYFEGAIDEVRIYDRVLTAREAMDGYYGGGYAERYDGVVSDALGTDELEAYRAGIETLGSMQRPMPAYVDVLCIMESGSTPQETWVLNRGNPHVPGGLVVPSVPAMILSHPVEFEVSAEDAASSGRRLALANWITDKRNRRTARVMMNRVWQYHFGRGLVRTPNDFGSFGFAPTHPELLDYLAVEFMERNWSVKEMHRLIMMSRTYRMSSDENAAAMAVDPLNDLMWRFDMRRLTAEEIRDSVLSVNGSLNLETGGPSVYPPMPREVLETASRPGAAWGQSSEEQANRRSIYIHVKRSLLSPMLTSFDMADTDSTCPVRFATTQPTQALTMLNSEFAHAQSAVFADRLRAEAGANDEARVRLGLSLVLCRQPTADEIARGLELVAELRLDPDVAGDKVLDYFCLVLLNLNEFVYLD